ncbi:hypothetical protein TRAPUB_7924 [Trametes pubescens]|uniref:Uncharacterized protein n=1 Tax=Trametes pubescens TaxID=154538 RepID=A0A1M2V213_TRAPU|nr:hypothetical protein TRAPUB_7924 [Trametes pubescens]
MAEVIVVAVTWVEMTRIRYRHSGDIGKVSQDRVWTRFSHVFYENEGTSDGAGSASLLQFVRADIDKWIQSRSMSGPALPDSMIPLGAAQWEDECIVALEAVQRNVIGYVPAHGRVWELDGLRTSGPLDG